MNYSPIHIDDVSNIQEVARQLFPFDVFKKTGLLYVKGSQTKLREVPAIQSLLRKLNLEGHLLENTFSYHLTKAKTDINVHTDGNTFKYSLNIPLTSTKQYFLEFYDTNVRSITESLTKYGVNYNLEDCTLIERIEIDGPFIIDTTIPHRVVNESNEPVLLLLTRLSPTLDNLASCTGFEPVLPT